MNTIKNLALALALTAGLPAALAQDAPAPKPADAAPAADTVQPEAAKRASWLVESVIATLPSSLPAMSVLLSEKRQSPRVTTTLPMALRLPRWAMASAAFAKGKRSET